MKELNARVKLRLFPIFYFEIQLITIYLTVLYLGEVCKRRKFINLEMWAKQQTYHQFSLSIFFGM